MQTLCTETTCFDVDDLCFPSALLALVFQRFTHAWTYTETYAHAHTHTDKAHTIDSRKARLRCKFTHKQPDKHTITQPPSPTFLLRQTEPDLTEALTSDFTVEGQCAVQTVSQARTFLYSERAHCYPCQINMLAGEKEKERGRN